MAGRCGEARRRDGFVLPRRLCNRRFRSDRLGHAEGGEHVVGDGRGRPEAGLLQRLGDGMDDGRADAAGVAEAQLRLGRMDVDVDLGRIDGEEQGDRREAVAEKIFDYTITSLDWVRNRLDGQAIRKAVDILANAKRIEFFGFGASGIVARDAQQKFPLFDVPCGVEIDSHQQIMVASMLSPGDVLVVISNTAATTSLLDTAELARKRGAVVLGLVGMHGPLVEHCDHVVLVETLENTNIYTPTISRIAALAVIDILSTAVALRRGEEHVESFGEMKKHLSYLRTDDD